MAWRRWSLCYGAGYLRGLVARVQASQQSPAIGKRVSGEQVWLPGECTTDRHDRARITNEAASARWGLGRHCAVAHGVCNAIDDVPLGPVGAQATFRAIFSIRQGHLIRKIAAAVVAAISVGLIASVLLDVAAGGLQADARSMDAGVEPSIDAGVRAGVDGGEQRKIARLQNWPYCERGCLRDSCQPDRKAKAARIIAIDRLTNGAM